MSVTRKDIFVHSNQLTLNQPMILLFIFGCQIAAKMTAFKPKIKFDDTILIRWNLSCLEYVVGDMVVMTLCDHYGILCVV